MPPFDVGRRELMAALDAFVAERKLRTKGRAIRVLVTDMLTQLGYLEDLRTRGVWPGGPIHRSSNGDDWMLTRDDAGSVRVIHRANSSSGGKETTYPVEEFLQRNGDSPEGRAVHAAIDADRGPAVGLRFQEKKPD